jgi:hypothetical protein|tara:strand:+ start:132 stop:332 length:201 start_codon:yes stop_codon:yes gene_type:complete
MKRLLDCPLDRIPLTTIHSIQYTGSLGRKIVSKKLRLKTCQYFYPYTQYGVIGVMSWTIPLTKIRE